jgi:N-acyl homoserine lactone hydrolase
MTMRTSILILRCGEVIVRDSLSVYAFLIEHPHGLILVDTGWHTDVRNGSSFYLGKKLNRSGKGMLRSGEAINERLSKLGLHPRDIDYVFLTHLDCDQVSGLKLVSAAKRILASRPELESAQKLKHRYKPEMWRGTRLEAFDFDDSFDGPVRKINDFFGDGSFRLVWTPGHSAGMTSIIVNTGQQYVVIAGDVGYYPTDRNEAAANGIDVDRTMMEKSERWIRSLTVTHRCRAVLKSHDRECKQGIVRLE